MNIAHDEPATGDSVEALEHGLRRLMWIEQKRMEHLLHAHDLTVPQFLVLINLVHVEEGCAIGDLANRLFQSNATMSGIIDRLELEQLVARTRGGEEDRRKVMVQVTPKGRALLEKASHSRHEQMRRALEHFGSNDLETFARLLDSYIHALEKES